MKKLRLDVEELTVESFPTASTGDERGTVRAHFATDPCTNVQKTCMNETYDDSLCGLSQAGCTEIPGVC